MNGRIRIAERTLALCLALLLIGVSAGVNSVAENEGLQATAAATEAKTAQFRKVGGCVTFGTYPQTKAGNDRTPIEWLVLDYDANNNRALLLSRYGLDSQPYNTERKSVTWENCTLRTWLNKTFLNTAFTAQEQAAILTTDVDNGKHQGYSGWNRDGGNNTQDRIFLLSYAEANKYLSLNPNDRTNTKSRVSPTDYAVWQADASASGSHMTSDGSAAGAWWLRSPGTDSIGIAYVTDLGVLFDCSVNFAGVCVRPALWIDLAPESF